MIVVVLVVFGTVEALAEAEFGLDLKPEVTGFTPVRFLPIEDQQPTEEHAAEVGEMGNIIRRQTGYRAEACKEFNQGIYNNEYARTYRHRDEKDVHRHIGIEPSESEQDTEHGAGSTDGVEHPRIIHDRRRIVRTAHIREHEHPNEFLDHRRTETADEVIEREATRSPLLLNHGCEHPYREHVKEDMAEIRMEEHIGERLPPMERRCGDIMQSAERVQINTITLQDRSKEEDTKISYQQIAGYCW